MPNAVRPFQRKPLRRLRGKATVKAFTCSQQQKGRGQRRPRRARGRGKVENWKSGDKVVTAKSGKRKRSNCLIRIQSKGSPRFIQIHSHLHSPWLLAHSLHSRRSIHGHFRWQTTIGAHQRDALWLLSIFGLFGSGAASKGSGLRVLLICI